MDGKEIKSLLKQARDAIKEKEYKTALKHCKVMHECIYYSHMYFV